MHKKYLIVTAIACALSPALAAGGTAEPQSGPGHYPIDIVVTTGMIGDIVEHVAGRHAEVRVLMGEEVDPHLYRPTRADVARMQRADVIFYNGLNLEGQMVDTLEQLSRSRAVIAVTERVEEAVLLDHEDYEESYDPHLWMDVRLWMEAVTVVADALAEYDPEHDAEYQANADAYRTQLVELDAFIRTIVETIPPERRVLITAHDAFRYFGKAYGFEVLGVQGLTTESEAGLEDINAIVRFIVDRGIAAVFAESTVADRALQAVIEGVAARGHTVRIGGELYSDAMGPAGTHEGTYIGMLEHNATTIVRALGGEVPGDKE